MSYSRETEEELGATPGITATSQFKAINTSMVPKSVVVSQLTPVAPGPGGSALGMGLLVVGLGLGGFLLYRHFKKKQAGSDPTT